MVAHAMAVDATARAAHGIATTQVPLGLELRHLRYLAAVADAGTFTRAAERLFIAQPTLSQQIRRLEQIVGTPLLHRRRDGVRLTAAGTVLLEAARDVLSRVDHAVAQTRQAAGLGRPRLRFALPADLPDSLAVQTASRLRSAADPAGVAITWLETALDAELSPIRQHRADAGLGWLTASPDTLPAPLDAMSLGQFEPDVWIPSSHPAARRGVIGLDELASMDVIHGPRRQHRDLRPLAGGPAGHRPAVRVHRPASAALPADGAQLRRHRQPAHRRADRPHRHRRTPARRDPATPPGRRRRHGPGQHRRPPADRDGRPDLERRPAPPAAADPVRHRRRPDPASTASLSPAG